MFNFYKAGINNKSSFRPTLTYLINCLYGYALTIKEEKKPNILSFMI